jgi:chitinase
MIKVKVTSFSGAIGKALVQIKNTGKFPLYDWSFSFIPSNFTITDIWAFNYKENRLTPKIWNSTIAPGETVESTFNFKGESDKLFLVSEDAQVEQEARILIGYVTDAKSIGKVEPEKLTHLSFGYMAPHPLREDYDYFIAKSGTKYTAKYREDREEGQLSFVKDEDKECISHLRSLKLRNKDLKLLISVGGYQHSWLFSKVMKSTKARQTLVKSICLFVEENNFDGVDIDWEYVGKQGVGYNYVDETRDGPNFIVFLNELRKQLPAEKQIICTVGANVNVIKNYEGIDPFVDYVCAMTYDYCGSKHLGHHTPLYHNPKLNVPVDNNIQSTVNNLRRYIPSDKICIGSPMYARGWEKIVWNKVGLPFEGLQKGTVKDALALLDLHGTVRGEDWIVDMDPVSKASWAYNTRNGETWSFESRASATEKARFVYENNLAGVFLWDVTFDDPEDSIVDLYASAFGLANITCRAESLDERLETFAISEESAPTASAPTASAPTASAAPSGQITEALARVEISIINTGTTPIIIAPGTTLKLELSNLYK